MDRLMSLVQTEVRAPVGRYSAMLRIIPQLAAVLDRVSRQVAEPGLHRDSAQRDKATHHYRKYSADRRQSGWMLPEPARRRPSQHPQADSMLQSDRLVRGGVEAPVRRIDKFGRQSGLQKHVPGEGIFD